MIATFQGKETITFRMRDLVVRLWKKCRAGKIKRSRREERLG